MKVTYDKNTDSLYIRFSDKAKSRETRELTESIVADYAGKKIVGIEILDASKTLAKKNIKELSSLNTLSV